MKYLITLISLLGSTVLFANEDVDKTLPAAASGKVTIKIIEGDVTINGWDRPEIRVQGELDSDDSEFNFEKMGNQIVIELEPDKHSHKRSWGSSSAELTVSVPFDTFLETTGMSTDFTINHINGSVRAHSLSGRVKLSNINAAMNIETVSGDIDVEASQGKMRLSSVSGDINTEGKTNLLDLNTVSGDVEATVGEVSSVDFTSVSGDLDLSFTLAKQGQLEANTVSGDMNFYFSDNNVNTRFDLETGPGGEIKNRLTSDRPTESFIHSEKLSFMIGKGHGSIEVETMSGTIDLRKK